jgi:hypothetical protein
LKAPSIVVVDRGTALEQQASGSFDDVEHRLNRAATTPRPAALTPEQLEALGLHKPDAVAGARLTEADEVDVLHVRHCIGEGSDGFLVDTPDACHGVPDPDAIMHAIDSVNRARRQLWRFMRAGREDVSLDDLRRRWRELHVAGVVCGGWIQADDGTWRAKSC